MTKTPKKPAKSGDEPANGTLTVRQKEAESSAKAMARVSTDPTTTAAATMQTFAVGTVGELNLTACMDVLGDTTKAVRGGNLRIAEDMLTAQAMSLNMIFTELARRSALNMGQYLDTSERYMRLALKAQGQCRATLETLAAIKNPPVVFARQANINNGGHQQVNNGGSAPVAGQPAQAGKVESAPTELLEATHVQRLDTGAASKAGRADPCMATVGAVNRP